MKTASLLSACLLVSCFSINKQFKGQARQGVEGYVYEKKGNAMPQLGKPFSKGRGFATQVYIFEPTTIQPTSVTEGLLTKPGTRLIGKFATDSIGRFKINLMPGRYSVLMGYEGAYFAPNFNQMNEVGIIQVLPGIFTSMEVIINVKASY